MGSFCCMFHPTTSLSYSHEEKKGLGFIDGNLWAQLHSFFKKDPQIHWSVYMYLWKTFAVHTSKWEVISSKLSKLLCTKKVHLAQSQSRIFYEAQVSGTKGTEIKCLMTQSFLLSPIFFYLHPQVHPHIAFQIIFTEGYFTKSAHIALFSFIKMNCWCASVQKTNVQSQTALCPSPKRMPSVSGMCLSLMYSHRVQCWQRSVT